MGGDVLRCTKLWLQSVKVSKLSVADYKYFSLQYNPTCQIWSLSGCGQSLADGNKWFKLCDLGCTWPKCCWKACYFMISVQMSSFLTRKAPEFCLQFLRWAILYIMIFQGTKVWFKLEYKISLEQPITVLQGPHWTPFKKLIFECWIASLMLWHAAGKILKILMQKNSFQKWWVRGSFFFIIIWMS